MLGHLSVALHSPRGRDPGSSQSREEAAPRGSPGAPEGSRAPQAGRWCPGVRGTLGTSRVLHIHGECHPCCLSKGSGHSNELGTRCSCEAPEASGCWNLSPALMNPSPRQERAAGPRRSRLRSESRGEFLETVLPSLGIGICRQLPGDYAAWLGLGILHLSAWEGGSAEDCLGQR